MTVQPWELGTGLALDLLFGDPHWFPHPVRGIGWIAKQAEWLWRGTGLPLRVSGVFFWMTVTGATVAVVAVTLPWLNVFWIWAFLALRSLDQECTAVLKADGIEEARGRLGFIVGRDTAHLEEPEILRAVLETMSENASDGVVAPLFYLAVGGPIAMAAYKAINTLDSTVGYKNDRYAQFGWFSARADDVANWLPARLTAMLVWLAAFVLRLDARGSVAVTIRDGGSQPSPNSGYPEAAFAGALQVQLGGVNHYRGTPSTKAHLGDPIRPLNREAFGDARKLLYVSAALLIGGILLW